MARKKKEVNSEKEQTPQVTQQEVPPRQGITPTVIKPVTKEIQQAAEKQQAHQPKPQAPTPPPQQLYSQLEIQVLVYGHKLIQDCKNKAGFEVTGTSLRYHDLEFMERIATVAVQRTQICNQLKQENNDLKTQIEVYKNLLEADKEDGK